MNRRYAHALLLALALSSSKHAVGELDQGCALRRDRDDLAVAARP